MGAGVGVAVGGGEVMVVVILLLLIHGHQVKTTARSRGIRVPALQWLVKPMLRQEKIVVVVVVVEVVLLLETMGAVLVPDHSLHSRTTMI